MSSQRSKDILNFVVTGQVRCGASVIQTSVRSHPKATCHGDLLHHEEDVRRETHEEYFGAPFKAAMPEHCIPGEVNPEQYLSARVFDSPLNGEEAIGVKVLFPHLKANDLWEFLHERSLEGDFCTILVLRNPVACYVSWKQALQTGVFQQDIDDRQPLNSPLPVDLEPSKLVPFVRWHVAFEERIRQYCDDRLEIHYRELFLNYHEVMGQVFEYLELPPYAAVTPSCRRLKNRSMRQRIANFHTVRLELPDDVRVYLDAEDLF